MKLYYSKGACSLAPHIALHELEIPFEAVPVDLRKEPSPEYLKLNPMGAVPVILMDNGQPLTEVAVILMYLADQKPQANLAPKPGTSERYRLQEWLNFIATEIHKGFAPLWYVDYLTQNPGAREEIRTFTLVDLGRKFDVITQKMGTQSYVMPSGYTIADSYLFAILNWASMLKIDLSRWTSITTYVERVKSRPGTVKALKAEHLT